MRFRFVLNSAEYGALVLAEEPGGWKDIQIMLKRSLEYHDVLYEAMADLDFKCRSGKEYIDRAIEEIGVDAVINITIYISCSSGSGGIEAPDYSIDYSDDYGSMLSGSGAPIFEILFEGVLELNNYKQTSETTEVSIVQSDFIQKVLNRFETQVEVTKNVSLDDVALAPIADFPSAITMHSKQLILTSEFEKYDVTDSLFVPFPTDTLNIEVPVVAVSDDIGGARDTSAPYIFSFFSSGAPSGFQNTEPIFENTTAQDITVDLTINIEGILSIRNSLSSTVNYAFYLQLGTQFSYVPAPVTIDSINGITLTGGVTLNITVSTSGTTTQVIPPGWKIFLTWSIGDVVGNVSSPALFEYLGFSATTFEVSMRNESTTAASEAGIFKIHELGSAISQRITSQEDAFRSTLLGRKNSLPTDYDSNGCGSFMGSLNGKHIRGFTAPDTPYFCSMKEFFQTMNAILNVGLGVDKEDDTYILRLEKKDYFYDSTVILQCPKAANIKTSVAKEYYISDIYVGYEKWETENVNGIDEFNTKRQYNTQIKSIESRLNVESPMIASMYSIELARRQGVSTYDFRYDKDNFIIALARGLDGSGNPNQLNQAEKDENFDTVTGFISPETAYNIRLSPVRNLLNHFNVIASSITKFANRAVKFVYGEGNFEVVSEFTNETCDNSFLNEPLDEGQDITVEETGLSPIWIPEYVEFEYPLTFSDYLSIKENKRQCIEVSETDTDFIKGFIIDLRYKPVGGIATFKLLKAWQ